MPASQERWYAEMRAGRAFARGINLGAVAATIQEIQLFNPVGSGKTIDVYRLIVATNVADGIQIRVFNTALTTLQGTGINLQSGGSAGVGEVRNNNPGAADGTFVGSLYSAAGVPWDRIAVWGVELDAGEGIIVCSQNVNIAVAAEYYWNEF